MIIRNKVEQIEPYLKDASNYRGNCNIVYVPENLSELKQAVLECKANNSAITISGAGTGLTGGRSPIEGAIISTEIINKIIDIDYEKQIATVEPGVTLAELEQTLAPNNFFYPPNPTEKNSSLGGNVATNASGARTFKYGATREYVMGLDLLLPTGDEIKLQRGKVIANGAKMSIPTLSGNTIEFDIPQIKIPNVKHAAGYYLKPGMDAIDLFIGSEGTFAIVQEIKLKFMAAPQETLGSIVFFANNDELFGFLDYARSLRNDSSENQDEIICPRLLEYFDSNSLKLLSKKFPHIPDNSAGAIWFEQEYDLRNEDYMLNEWSKIIVNFSSMSDDAWIAMSPAEHERQREFRHSMPLEVSDIISRNGMRKIGTDTAVPEEHFRNYYEFVKSMLEHYALTYVIFGHFGNCHIHANALPANNTEFETGLQFYDECISEALRLGGTVSAEHGIGKIKRKYLHQMFGEDVIKKMFEIKLKFDPENLLGRGNLF